MILLKNTTGQRSGSYISLDYGEDLFGYLYLDVAHFRKHKARKLKSRLYDDPKRFICELDVEIYHKENRNYIPVGNFN